MTVRREQLLLTASAGTMRTSLFAPDAMPLGAMVMFMDVFGIRPELFDLARAYAQEGFAVYLPNLFYRAGDVSFPTPSGPDDRTDSQALRLNGETTLEMTASDLPAIFAHAAATLPAGLCFAAIGYCMGGRHAIKALSAWPDTVRAAATIHGGRLVTSDANSPHLLIAGLRSSAYFAFAADDLACPQTHQSLITEAVAQAPVPHRIEHFAARHGWSFPQRYCHDPAAASRVFTVTRSLFLQACGADNER
jgi:carboxymethylenebutenolidase